MNVAANNFATYPKYPNMTELTKLIKTDCKPQNLFARNDKIRFQTKALIIFSIKKLEKAK